MDRRQRILQAALTELRDRGYARTSMLAIASAAHSSKETLYRLFGDKQGLFAALVRENAAAINEAVSRALAEPAESPEETLRAFGLGLLRLLLGERSVAINRAAIAEAAQSSELGRILAAEGRGTTGALVLDFLRLHQERGVLNFPSAEEAFEVFLGLLLRDRQTRLLIGAITPPTEDELLGLTDRAVTYFMRLFGTANRGPGDTSSGTHGGS